MYTADLTTLIEQHSFCKHFYADDTQVYGSSRPLATLWSLAASVGVHS